MNIEAEEKRKERKREREGGREGGEAEKDTEEKLVLCIYVYTLYIYIHHIYYDSVGFDGNCVGKPMGFTCFYQWLFLAVSFIQFDGFRMAVKDHPCHPNKN